MLRLNRLKMYLAANISNPFVAPWLVFLEIQAGAWLRRGSFHPLTVEAVKDTSLATLRRGSAHRQRRGWRRARRARGGLTYAVVRGTGDRDAFTELVRLASDRYIDAGIVAWEFARGKLRPIHLQGRRVRRPVDAPRHACPWRSALHRGGWRNAAGSRLRHGLTLALLAEARRAERGRRRGRRPGRRRRVRPHDRHRHPRPRRRDCVSGAWLATPTSSPPTPARPQPLGRNGPALRRAAHDARGRSRRRCSRRWPPRSIQAA